MEQKIFTSQQLIEMEKNGDIVINTPAIKHAIKHHHGDYENMPTALVYMMKDSALRNDSVAIADIYFCIVDNNAIIGALKLQQFSESYYHEKKNFWSLSYITVRNGKKWRDKGYSKILIRMMVEWLKANNINWISRTAPSPDGYNYSYNNITNALKESGIQYFERY